MLDKFIDVSCAIVLFFLTIWVVIDTIGFVIYVITGVLGGV